MGLILLTTLFIFVCILMILIVLLQPSQGEGLGSAFGGGISESFFGTRAMTWLGRATIVLAMVFLVLAVVLNLMPRDTSGDDKGPASIMNTGPAVPAPGEAEMPASPPTTHPPTAVPTPKPVEKPADKPAPTAPTAPAGEKPAEPPSPKPDAGVTPAPNPAPTAPAPEKAPQ